MPSRVRGMIAWGNRRFDPLIAGALTCLGIAFGIPEWTGSGLVSFDGACCTIDPKKESHMNALTFRFDDADTITASCKAYMEGKEMPEHPTTFKRVKDAATAAR